MAEMEESLTDPARTDDIDAEESPFKVRDSFKSYVELEKTN